MLIFKVGGFLGWLSIFLFAGAIANYVIKLVNVSWGKQISGFPAGKKIMFFLLKVFTKNHRFFGIGAFLALYFHFIIQFVRFGISVSGVIAAALLVLQAVLGIYAVARKKPRSGAWFIVHRVFAVLLILGIAAHLLIPAVLHDTETSETPTNTSETSETTNTSSTSGTTSTASTSTAVLKVFTLDELAKDNGQNGQPAYVAYKGSVYDVSNVPQWRNGTHNGEKAGTDITNDLSKSPHGDSVIANLPKVGTLQT